jgi:hypothetical protein
VKSSPTYRTFGEHSWNIQGTCREHSGYIQGTFREHLGNIELHIGLIIVLSKVITNILRNPLDGKIEVVREHCLRALINA